MSLQSSDPPRGERATRPARRTLETRISTPKLYILVTREGKTPPSTRTGWVKLDAPALLKTQREKERNSGEREREREKFAKVSAGLESGAVTMKSHCEAGVATAEFDSMEN